MSASLVRQSLALVDPEFTQLEGKKKAKKVKRALDLIPENKKVTKRLNRKGRPAETVNLLQGNTKLTVLEARKKCKSKEKILEENLRKLQKIREICTISLDDKITKQIIERAVTRRPIKSEPVKKGSQKTAFTEEDFKKFEEEYFDDGHL